MIIGDSVLIAHDAKKVAETASHEVGHTLGLSHDGTSTLAYYEGHGSGETGWAPIMGTAYYQNLTQFSKGEYPDADNHQDDIAVIAANGAPLRTDDHGNTIATATSVPCDSGGSTDLLANIGTGDIDVFKLHLGAGSLNINVVKPIGTNTDTELTVYDSLGSAIAVDNPIDLLGNTSNVSIAQAGDYYVALKGVGKGDLVTGYSSYGSLGINQIHLSSYVCDVPPTVNAGLDKLNVQRDSTVILSAQGTGSQLTYKWDIITTPKNSKSMLASPNVSSTSFVPDKVGDYILSVTVKDSVERTSSDSITVSVVKKNADKD